MDKKAVARAFNEWMRRYIEEPERFKREFQAVREYLDANALGVEPTYGETSAEFLDQLMSEQGQSAAVAQTPPAPVA